jgi:ribosomal protein S18 acetylase RimI-like enzyme
LKRYSSSGDIPLKPGWCSLRIDPQHGSHNPAQPTFRLTMLNTTSFGTPAIAIRTAEDDDAASLFNILTRAFIADPAARWLFPEPERYRTCYPILARLLCGDAMTHRTAFVSEDVAAAAAWHDPFSAPDDVALADFLDESIAPSRKAAAFAVFARMRDRHPRESHWYLPLIGVIPTMQRRGHGAALMRQALRLCDQTGMPAYLEATTRRSVPFYKSFGFQVTGEIAVGDCPILYPMVREAR